MILPMLLALQTPAMPASDRPIRIWMDAPGQVSRGHGVRLYIEAAAAGNLVVLHSRSDGKIEVLFPARPTDDPHVTAGTWEVRGKGDGPIWTVSEPDGKGMILAALTPDPVWFDEFSHDVSWNPGALEPSWSGADPEGGMQDIVQRMLGDGGFTYDVLTYLVVPEAIAQAPGSGWGSRQVAPAFQSSGQVQSSEDTFPTIDNTPQDASKLCDVSNADVQCSLLNQPLVFGRGFRHRHRLAQPAPAPAFPTPANPQAIALMVTPIRSTPRAPSPGSTPVVPRRRPVPEAPVRNRSSDPAPSAVRTLASRPVAGAEGGRLAGAAPAARSAMVLRYVHPPLQVPGTSVSGVTPSTEPAAPPVERAPTTPTTVAANLPIRTGGTMLMSRSMSPSAVRSAAPSTAGVAARPSTAATAVSGRVAPRTVGGWMVMPRRR